MVPVAAKFKLSASALAAYLKSPRNFYYGYVVRLEPLQPSVGTFDHDKICGTLWASFVERFYKGASEESNTKAMLSSWAEQTDSWVPETTRKRLSDAMSAWAVTYYQQFAPTDGVRNGNELHLENERFVAYLDGLSHDRVVHEVKSTSRSRQLAGQLWKVQNSVQVKLYSVMADATGHRIEFAWKDAPYGIYRAEIVPVTDAQKAAWEQQLNTLADHIYSLGDDINNYPCHPDGCCITTKNYTGMCQYQPLCANIEGAEIAFKKREHRK